MDLRQPEPLCLEGNLAENWRCWLSGFDLYKIATGLDAKDDKIQAATFLHLIGPDARRISDTFTFETAGDKQKLTPLTDRFQAYCQPRKNLTYVRHLFFTRAQAPGETFDSFLLDLRGKARQCEFDALHDSLVKDRIVAGITNDSLRVRLLRDTTLTLDTAIQACRAAEASVQELQSLAATNPTPSSSATVHGLQEQ